MEAGPGGVRGRAVISVAAADARYALAPALVLHLKMVERSVQERRTK